MSDAIVFIPLTRGKVAVIDFEDFEKVRPHKWHAYKAPNTFYAYRFIGRRCIPMHRLILDAPVGMEVDHIDGDGLNNCKGNIRLCSHAQNNQAHKTKTNGSTSRFRGVSWCKRDSIWVARLKMKGAQFCLGSFENEEDAARAYDTKARELFGEFASPNFPT